MQCISAPKFLTSQNSLTDRCKGYSRVEALKRAQDVNDVLRSHSKKHGAIFIDPFEVFCSEESEACLKIKDGKILYRDRNHLSEAGAILLAQRVFDELGW